MARVTRGYERQCTARLQGKKCRRRAVGAMLWQAAFSASFQHPTSGAHYCSEHLDMAVMQNLAPRLYPGEVVLALARRAHGQVLA